MGEPQQADLHFEDALSFSRIAGYSPELAWTCHDYAETLIERGDRADQAKATELLEGSFEVARELGHGRAGVNIKAEIEAALKLARRHHIIWFEDGVYGQECGKIHDYKRVELIDVLRNVVGRTWTERPEAIRLAVLAEAQRIQEEDIQANRRLGRLGAELLPERATVLTHCNAGALATAGYGPALGVVRAALEAGEQIPVLASETRPQVPGARLTASGPARDGRTLTR